MLSLSAESIILARMPSSSPRFFQCSSPSISCGNCVRRSFRTKLFPCHSTRERPSPSSLANPGLIAGVTEASHSSGRSRPKRPASLCQRSIPVPPLYVRRTRIGSTFSGTPNSGTNGFFVTVRSPLLQLSGTSSVV